MHINPRATITATVYWSIGSNKLVSRKWPRLLIPSYYLQPYAVTEPYSNTIILVLFQNILRQVLVERKAVAVVLMIERSLNCTGRKRREPVEDRCLAWILAITAAILASECAIMQIRPWY